MIDALLHASIARRWIVFFLAAAIGALGIWNYQHLPIDAVPDITNVQVQINARAPGYTPLETESRITFPIESEMGGIPGLHEFRSISKYGLAQVTAVFEDGTDLYFARQLVNERLQSVRESLPSGVDLEMGPAATGLGEILMYVLEAEPDARKSDGTPYDATDLRTIQDWTIRPLLRQVPGVSEVDSIGGYARQFHVLPDPARLLSYGLTLSDIENALQANNGNVGAGYIETNGEQNLVRVPGQLKGIPDLRNVVVASRNGVPVRIGDVADVAQGRPLRTGAAVLGTRQTVLSTAYMRVGENSRSVSLAVSHRLAEISKSLPPGVHATTVYDRTDLVNRTIATVQKNLLEGAVLVLAVLLLMLGNVRAALLTAMVIPLSMLMLVTSMVQTKVSANLMSLGALDFGLIVDGAVIIVENCIRRLAERQRHLGRLLTAEERWHETHAGAREVFTPSLVSVLVVILVNLPLLALTGVEGKMFRPMALTVILALLAALLLSLTFVPAAVALFLRGKVEEKENILVRSARRLYVPVFAFAMRRRIPIVLCAVLLVLGCGFLATRMGTEFIPQLDEGDVVILVARIPGIGLEQAVSMQEGVHAALQKHAELKLVYSRTGTNDAATDPMSPSETDTFFILKPRQQWPDPYKSKAQLLGEIDATLATVPGMLYEFSQPIEMRFNELIAGVRAALAVKIYGDDFEKLEQLSRRAALLIRAVPGAEGVKAEPIGGLPTLTITPRLEALARFGLPQASLQQTIATAVGGTVVGQIFEGDARFDVVVRLPEHLRTSSTELERLPIAIPGGAFVPLVELADVQLASGANQVSRENGKRRVVVSANTSGRDLGSFVKDVQLRLARDLKLPPGYYVGYGGTFEQLQSAAQRLAVLVPLTLLMILLLLVLTFGSPLDAVLVFSGVPLALTGGVLSLVLRGIPLSITAGVGFITLSGVAVLTGVVM
ncbi:MAG TPA: CusA/CzcA family heavy metal efflux RND transporter, partial [Steroidobacteraceae bacterium]|nr:CusA/CzcA family heavy metal efflux RND transporter [Steroidobacteraceae bacterium]